MAERLIPGLGYASSDGLQRLIPGIGYAEESASGSAVDGIATGGVGTGAGSGAGGSATGTTGTINGDATGGTGAGTGSGSGGNASGQSIIIRDDYERSSVNVSMSSSTGSGDPSVITLKPRYQESEIVSGTRWWEVSARIDGVLGIRPTFTILDYQSGKLFGHPWTSSHRCHFSYDRETWYPFDTQTLDTVGYTASFRHNTAFTGDSVYFSNNPQFSVHQIGEWIASLDATYSAVAPTAAALAFTPTSAVSDYAAQGFIADEFSTQTDELSRTIPKTPLYAFEINDTSLMPIDGSGKRVAILTSGVHAAEDIANHCLKSFIATLLGSSAQAQNLRRRYRILVYPMINAPGRAGGGWRGSFTQGYSGYDDANRHFTSDLSQLEIVNKPKAAITTDRAGVAPDWAIDFHSQADSTWAMYVPGATESTFYTRQASNAGVTISDMGGDWATAMNSVDTYFHGLGAKLSITSELGDATYVSMSGIASYHSAMVNTLSSMLDDGYLISDAVATGGIGAGTSSGLGGSASGEASATASGGTGSGSSAGFGGDATGDDGGSATDPGGTGAGTSAGSGGSAVGGASPVVIPPTGTTIGNEITIPSVVTKTSASSVNVPPTARVPIGTVQSSSGVVDVYATPEWSRYFESLNRLTNQTASGPGGLSDINADDSWHDDLNAREALQGVDELRNDIASLRGENSALRQAIADIESSIAEYRQTIDFRLRIEQLEDRLT